MAIRSSLLHEEQKTASNWDKFKLLMWKNCLLQTRHKFRTIFEILIPLILMVLIVLIRRSVSSFGYNPITTFQSFNINELDLREVHYRSSDEKWKLAYSPKQSHIESFMETVSNLLNMEKPIGLHSLNHLEYNVSEQRILAGIEFNIPKNMTGLPKKLSYSLHFPSKLRSTYASDWKTNLLFPLNMSSKLRESYANYGGSPSYYDEGFLQIQNAISKAFIELTNKKIMPNIQMQRFPYPSYISDGFLDILSELMPLIILSSFLYPCINTVRYIAIEKEKQLKEAMKIMGLSNWLHWTGWFTIVMIYMIVINSLMILLFKLPVTESNVSIFTHSNWFLLWIFFIIYSIATTTFCFVLSVFFSKANTASLVTAILWFVSYQPYSIMIGEYAQLSLIKKLVACFFSNSAMGYGLQLIYRFERFGEGLNWSNLNESPSIDDNLTIFMIILMMLFSSVIHLLIALYIEQVKPGNYGVPQKWYFPLKKQFWFGMPDYTETIPMTETYTNSRINTQHFEPDPTNRRAGIKVVDLRKMYSKNKIAVNGLTMNMYDDQITILLGHNGAGKTTTMSMLTGMFPPTSGTAFINGYDIRTNTQKARNSLGLCPQHNILFDELTVKEHIQFFSRLKGLDSQSVDEEVQTYVRLLELEPKIDAMSSTLSGGMKRKLSVALALCGKSKVVLCDEPTSGMDPSARRALWDLLQTEKKGRTILLSTHFMDEADILGDRIAIMADGELKCCGSSFFLKKQFGAGYHLICVKNDDCNVQNVTHLIQKYIPNVQIQSNIGQELIYLLPNEKISQFEQIFNEIEEQKEKLHLNSFGVSLTALEEVFLKVGIDSTRIHYDNSVNDNQSTYDCESFICVNGDELFGHNVRLVKGINLWLNQFISMFKKRFICWKRSWILFIIQNCLPLFFILISFLIAEAVTSNIVLPSIQINLNSYKKTVTILEEGDKSRFSEKYIKLFDNVDNAEISIIHENMNEYFLKKSQAQLMLTNSQYLIGATISEKNDSLIAWFNGQPYHTAPLSLNLMHNAIIHSLLGDDYNLEIFNTPLPISDNGKQTVNNRRDEIFLVAVIVNLGFAMSFVTALYTMFYIKERICGAKQLQFVSGANVFVFWLTSFVWDYMTFILTVIITVCTLAIFQNDWKESSSLAIIFLIFGFAVIPFNFIASFIFETPSGGFAGVSFISFIFGVPIFSIIMILGDGYIGYILQYIMMIFPHFALSKCFLFLGIHHTSKKSINYFDWKEPGIGKNLVIMIATGIILFALLMIIEYRIFSRIFYTFLKKSEIPVTPDNENHTMDSNVFEEKERVHAMTQNDIVNENLVLRSISKIYGHFVAVNEISFSIKSAECFGLLGANGAGKTSTFKMLTGNEQISNGNAWARGICLKTKMTNVYKIIGYCPQFDALFEDLTGRETIEMFSLLRGISRYNINKIIESIATELNVIDHIDKKVSELSGGNRRKLSTAVSLIGNPNLIYLDEPSTGMDPGAKRNLWNVLSRVRNSGISIILTSHSMEECEALCTRIAIMVNGEFKCLGSIQHLKNKFSKGFILNVKMKLSLNNENITDGNDNALQIKEFVSSNFPAAVLREEHQGLLTYHIPTSTKLKWSKMFRKMENCKGKYQIEDYSISQTSLEQVFLSFTKHQP